VQARSISADSSGDEPGASSTSITLRPAGDNPRASARARQRQIGRREEQPELLAKQHPRAIRMRRHGRALCVRSTHVVACVVVAQPQQVVVRADRGHEPDRRTRVLLGRGDQRQSAGEADADDADGGRVRAGRVRRSQLPNLAAGAALQPVLEQLRQLRRQHVQPASRQRARERDQARFIDAARMHAVQQHHARRAPGSSGAIAIRAHARRP
jgi:hypothetical protein